MPPKQAAIDLESAEAAAIAALAFIAAEPERLGRFLSLTGLGPENLRKAAGEPGFLVAVLDHVLADQSELFVFAETAGLSPEAIEAARHRIAGTGPAGGLNP
ncbi:MAG: DUF3572 domain-containing protein [Hyphomicrobiales bacterium]